MPNPVKGEVALKVDDRELTLVFDMDALVRAEDAYGQPLPVLMERVQRGFFGAIRVLFWAAMQRHQPGTAMDEVDVILTEHSEALEAMLKAYEKAMPDAEGKKGANPPGKTSGGNGAKRAKRPKRSGG